MRPLFSFLLLGLLLTLVPSPGARADDTTDYPVGTGASNGAYRAHVPASWDGRSALPVLVFFHGFGQSGDLIMENTGFMDLAHPPGCWLSRPTVRRSAGPIRAPPRARAYGTMTRSSPPYWPT